MNMEKPQTPNPERKEPKSGISFDKIKKFAMVTAGMTLFNHAVIAQENKQYSNEESVPDTHLLSVNNNIKESYNDTVVVKSKEDEKYKNREDFETIIKAQEKLKELYDETWEKLKQYKDFNNLLSIVNKNFDTTDFKKHGTSRDAVLNMHGNIYSGEGLEKLKGSDYSPSVFIELAVKGDLGNYWPSKEFENDYINIKTRLDTSENILRDEVHEAEERLKKNGALPKYKGCIGCFSTYEAPEFETEVPKVKVLDYAFSRPRQAMELGSASFPERNKPLTDYFDKTGKLIGTF